MGSVFSIDDPFTGRLAALLTVSGIPLWMIGAFREWDIVSFIGMVFTLFGIALVFMRGKCVLQDDGIAYHNAFGKKALIPYDEVDWVKVDVEDTTAGGRGTSPGRVLIYKMTIITQQGNIVVKKQGGYIENKSALYDIYGRDRLLLCSPFAEAESFIREKKGLDPKPAALTSFLREAEAKRSSFGRI